jgi:hypothetical protein
LLAHARAAPCPARDARLARNPMPDERAAVRVL